MHTTTLMISAFDKERLERKIDQVLTDAHRIKHKELEYVRQLAAELAKATILNPEEVPADLVTMNSEVVLEDLDSQRELRYTLSFPAESNPLEGRVSILAPVGISLLGCRVGDTVEWTVPKGLRRFRIKALTFQPEAAGERHL
jgi:regulator of nucleoside diphosphate kinase